MDTDQDRRCGAQRGRAFLGCLYFVLGPSIILGFLVGMLSPSVAVAVTLGVLVLLAYYGFVLYVVHCYGRLRRKRDHELVAILTVVRLGRRARESLGARSLGA